jgi:hypothetical protein
MLIRGTRIAGVSPVGWTVSFIAAVLFISMFLMFFSYPASPTIRSC